VWQYTKSAESVAWLIQVAMSGGYGRKRRLLQVAKNGGVLRTSGCASTAKQNFWVGSNMRLKLPYLAH